MTDTQEVLQWVILVITSVTLLLLAFGGRWR